MNDSLASPDVLQRLAEWLERNGLDSAFISLSLVLLFLYFMKLIFKRSLESEINELQKLLIQVKMLLEDLLRRKP